MKVPATASRPEGAKERARAIVDREVWPTNEGPFVRVNDKPRDLERLVESIAALCAEYAREQENPKECDPCDGDDCERCRGTGLYCVNCETYTRAADLWQALLADERAELAHAVEVENALTQEKAALEAALAGIRNVSDDKTRIIEALEARERALRETLKRLHDISWHVASEINIQPGAPDEAIVDAHFKEWREAMDQSAAALAPRRGAL